MVKEKTAVKQLITNMSDSSLLVREQSTIALGAISNSHRDPEALFALKAATTGNDQKCAEIAKLILRGESEIAEKKYNILSIILERVKGSGFLDKYRKGLLKV